MDGVQAVARDSKSWPTTSGLELVVIAIVCRGRAIAKVIWTLAADVVRTVQKTPLIAMTDMVLLPLCKIASRMHRSAASAAQSLSMRWLGQRKLTENGSALRTTKLAKITSLRTMVTTTSSATKRAANSKRNVP